MRSLSKFSHLLLLLILAVGALTQGGCGEPALTPTAIVPSIPPTALVTEVVAIVTRTPTKMPTEAPTLAPTATATFAPTHTPLPEPTATQSPTVVPTATPAPMSDVRPQPDLELEQALRYQRNGEYDLAISAFLHILASEPGPELGREANYRLAETYVGNREYLAAIDAWEEFLSLYPGDPRTPQATLMLARALDRANECVRAIPHYQSYLSQRTILADLVHEWIGDCHSAAGNLEDAIAAYRDALKAVSDTSLEVSLREKIAGAYLLKQDYDGAVAEYDAILAVAKPEGYRARIEYMAGQALDAAALGEEALVRYRRAVDRYPEAEYAYLSLIELVDSGVAVDEFQRGMVDLNAGKVYPEAYGAAIRAFDRYLAGEAAPNADEALYRKAVAQRSAGQYSEALGTLDSLITRYPNSSWLADAWLQKAVVLALMEDIDGAVKMYDDLATSFPGSRLAPIALQRAANLRERSGRFLDAARRYVRLQTDFPAQEDADKALWLAGLDFYRGKDVQQAAGAWRALIAKYPKSAYRLKSLYWLGKLAGETDPSAAKEYWDQVVATAPGDYYALRVQQLRMNDSLTATRMITVALEPPLWDAIQAEAEIRSWLQTWTKVPTGARLASLPDTITRSQNLQRGQALLSIGLRREALDAFDRVRAAAWNDAIPLAQLSLYFREQSLHGLAARCALRVAGLWPAGTVHQVPPTLRRLAYPLVYADLISREALARDLDPLLLAALIRQESLFEPAAESYAGARGLGQVMPATGEGIARSLHIDGFALDDLYRPAISAQFGAFYLAVQMKRFDQQILKALAAYNGGPGNTLRWQEAGGDDLDLFVEVITANQSRVYLQRVYEQYLIYEELYRNFD